MRLVDVQAQRGIQLLSAGQPPAYQALDAAHDNLADNVGGTASQQAAGIAKQYDALAILDP